MLRKEVYINKNVIINNKKDFYKLYKKKIKELKDAIVGNVSLSLPLPFVVVVSFIVSILKKVN